MARGYASPRRLVDLADCEDPRCLKTIADLQDANAVHQLLDSLPGAGPVS